MSEWQPIETAPKDGQQLILFWYAFDGTSNMTVGWWDRARPWEGGGEGAGWVTPHARQCWPAMWHPLPEWPA